MARQEARGTFKNKTPERQPIEEWPDGVSLVRLRIAIAYSGDLEGQGFTLNLAASQKDGLSTFCAIERIEGSIAGRTGAFVDEQEGTWDDAGWRGSWHLVAGLGTGELAGLRGEGRWEMARSAEIDSWTLDYWFE
jgi:Protein of unknown function (DUF3224)